MPTSIRYGLGLASALVSALALLGVARAEVRVPVTACTTILQPGSYILTQNVLATGLADFDGCIILGADNITFDLNGYAVIGDGTGKGITQSGSRNGITVRNGTVANFGAAVDLETTTTCQLHDLRTLGSTGNSGFQQFQGYGIRVQRTCSISDSLAGDNRLGGYFTTGVLMIGNISSVSRRGFTIESFSVARGNVAEGGSSVFADGIVARQGSLVTGNVAHNNGGSGVAHFGIAQAPNSIVVTNNAVTENGQGGIDLSINDDDGALLKQNTSRSNPTGNLVGACVNCTIVDNQF